LHDVIAAKSALLVRCRRCRYRKLLMPAELAARLGADFPVEKLAPRLRCTSCGGRGMASVEEATR
jgi:hypothetical protein